MNFYVLTLFPEMLNEGLFHSIIKRAVDAKHIHIECVNIRDFAVSKYGQADDYPYGGGAGMVMMPAPICDAYDSVVAGRNKKPRTLFMSPQGRKFDQKLADELSKEEDLVIICGHYEGIDERVLEEIEPLEISLGDFVLTGGEIAAMAVIDAVARLVPGVLNNGDSPKDESFSNGLLEYPQYTRPFEFRGRKVPEVLISGHHGNIKKWRGEQALERTIRKRPDLLGKISDSGECNE